MLEEHENHTVEGQNVTTFLKYYPSKYKVSQEYNENRNVVYRFKDGNHIAVVPLFDSFIKRLKALNPAYDFWFCVIPSSGIETNQVRYEAFCHSVSTACGIKNGYNLLTPNCNRNQVHVGTSGRDYSQVLKSITFGDVKGKDLILCDDVMTTGKSFKIITGHLLSLGARSVYGLMLAKTHWVDENEI